MLCYDTNCLGFHVILMFMTKSRILEAYILSLCISYCMGSSATRRLSALCLRSVLRNHMHYVYVTTVPITDVWHAREKPMQ